MSEDKFTRFTTQDNFVSEKIDIIKNNLLGSYDDENKYFIAPQIIKELKELKKYKKSSFNNSAFCAGNLMGYGEIFFELEFDEQTTEDNQGKANFYVLENVDKINGYLQNVIRTKIGEFIAPLEDFIPKSYAFFNIFDDEENDEGKEKKTLEDLETDDSFILAKKQYSLMMDKLSDEKYLDAYGKFFSAKISLLTATDNDFCKAVLERFNQEYELIEKLFLGNKNYKVLNELVDKCLEEVSGTKEIYIEQEQSFRDTLAPELDEFSNSVEVLNEKFEGKALSMLSKDDQNKVNEIIESAEEHNRKIKESDDQNAELENTELESNEPVSDIPQEPIIDEPKQSNNPFEVTNDIKTNENEPDLENASQNVTDAELQPQMMEQQEQEQNQTNVDMDMMKSMFGIDPSYVDNRPQEAEEEPQESMDIMDMFRKKAETLATSPEYNGEEFIDSKSEEKPERNPFDFSDDEYAKQDIETNLQENEKAEGNETSQNLQIEENVQPQLQEQLESKEEEPVVQQPQESADTTTQERTDPKLRTMNDLFNRVRELQSKTSNLKEEKSNKSSQPNSEMPKEEELKSSVNDVIDYINTPIEKGSEEIIDHFSETIVNNSNQQGDVSTYYNPPIFENEESIMEDELYSDGIGSLFGEKFERSSQEVEEEQEIKKDQTSQISDEVGDIYSTVQITQTNQQELVQ